MNFKTNVDDLKANPLRLRYLFLYGVLVYLFIVSISPYFLNLLYSMFDFKLHIIIFTSPIAFVGALEIFQGIRDFGGDYASIVTPMHHYWILGICIINFILAPALFLWGIKKRTEYVFQGIDKTFLGMVFGIAVAGAVLYSASPVAAYKSPDTFDAIQLGDFLHGLQYAYKAGAVLAALSALTTLLAIKRK